jgi:hypothetical protein
MGKPFSRYFRAEAVAWQLTSLKKPNLEIDLMPSAPPVDFDGIRQQIHRVLCAHDNLEPSQTPLFHTVIMRHGKACGSFFHIQGPRLLKTYALWVRDEKRILFYDCKGERFQETRLREAHLASKLAA